MRALLLKELRGLLPFAVLMFASTASDILTRPFTERLDESSWPQIASYLLPGGGSQHAWVLIILSVVAAYSAFPRENDEGTIEFLYALPIAHWKIFAAKVSAGLLMLSGGLVLLQITDGIQGSLNTDTYGGGRWRFEVSASVLLLQFVFCAVLYGHALLASFLRRFGLIPYALVFMVLSFLGEAHATAAALDPKTLLDLQYHGSSVVIPWTLIAGQLAVAAVAYGAAYFAWGGAGERLTHAFAQAGESVQGRVAMGCGTLLASTAIFGLVVAMLVNDADTGEGDVGDDTLVELSTATRKRSTTWYDFLYPVAIEARAKALIEGSDELHEQIRASLGTSPGARIRADLSDISAAHRGIASWTHLRIALAQETDARDARHAFAHETVHAFQHQQAYRRLAVNDRVVDFFLEGSAEHIARRWIPDAETQRSGRLIAALAWSRHNIRFEDLCDSQRFDERLDDNLLYPLGESFSDALTARYGPDAIGAVLRALSRSDAPQGLEPRAFWEDTLRAAGYDLEATIVAWEALLQRTLDDERAFVERLPRIGGGVAGGSEQGIHLVGVLDRDLPEGAQVRVRVRRSRSASGGQRIEDECELRPGDRRRCDVYIPPDVAGAGRFQVLFGIVLTERGWPLYETWQSNQAP